MKKRMLGILLAGAMVMTALAGCGVKKPGEEASSQKSDSTQKSQEAGKETADKGGYELALITDVGTIDDKSFNQGSWEGLKKYADDNKISCKYYKPTEKSDEACLNAIDLAVKGGAKLIVTPGFLFEFPIYEAQTKYPDVHFILIDAAPTDKKKNVKIEKNVLSIFYAEEQAGYIAGYAAVKDGYHKLGFMGGIAVPAVVRYGYGYIQGADAAAKELGLKKGDVNIKYTYVGNFDATPENAAKASSWYNEGTECIFACGGGVGNSVMKSAESADKVVIGVDVDQSVESPTVITSAMKNLGNSVYNAVDSFYKNEFKGGVSITLGAAEDGIELPMESSKFKNFTKEDYEKIYAGLKDGSIKVEKDTVAEKPEEVPTEIVSVESIN